MESYILNDMEYDFKPLEIFVPDPDYKVDEKELEKSLEKRFVHVDIYFDQELLS